MEKLKFDQPIELNGIKLDKHYIQSLSKSERENLIDPIFDILRHTGFIYPDNQEILKKSYQRLQADQIDVSSDEVFNNSSLATDICKYFCHTFYGSTERGKPTLLQVFDDDKKLKRLIANRLGLDWLEQDGKGPGVNEAFNLSFKMFIQGMRSMRLVNPTSMFKPNIAKFLVEKYSAPGEVVGDYSCGFGGRLLGTMAAGRKYIGTDPLTVPELRQMKEFFNFQDATLIQQGSEVYCGEENSIDLYWSSPPYYDQEYYSSDLSQAYNNGEDYFYQVYWEETLKNVKFMLKPGKWFGLNILDKYQRMITMAKHHFGEPVEIIKLRTVRSHLNKTAGISKFEPVFMFKNTK